MFDIVNTNVIKVFVLNANIKYLLPFYKLQGIFFGSRYTFCGFFLDLRYSLIKRVLTTYLTTCTMQRKTCCKFYIENNSVNQFILNDIIKCFLVIL